MGKITITEKDVAEAAQEAARIIFHGMHPGGVGRQDELPKYHGFKKEMAHIIEREVRHRGMIFWELRLSICPPESIVEEDHDSNHD